MPWVRRCDHCTTASLFLLYKPENVDVSLLFTAQLRNKVSSGLRIFKTGEI